MALDDSVADARTLLEGYLGVAFERVDVERKTPIREQILRDKGNGNSSAERAEGRRFYLVEEVVVCNAITCATAYDSADSVAWHTPEYSLYALRTEGATFEYRREYFWSHRLVGCFLSLSFKTKI